MVVGNEVSRRGTDNQIFAHGPGYCHALKPMKGGSATEMGMAESTECTRVEAAIMHHTMGEMREEYLKQSAIGNRG